MSEARLGAFAQCGGIFRTGAAVVVAKAHKQQARVRSARLGLPRRGAGQEHAAERWWLNVPIQSETTAFYGELVFAVYSPVSREPSGKNVFVGGVR